jgi:hypothetical protein
MGTMIAGAFFGVNSFPQVALFGATLPARHPCKMIISSAPGANYGGHHEVDTGRNQ